MIHFDRKFMQTPWREFIYSVKRDMGAVHLVMGRDFSCGFRGEGTSDRISVWCRENGLGCDIVDEVRMGGVIVSSTYIRELIRQGQDL